MEISLGSEAGVINLEEVSRRYGVSIEALKETINGQNRPGFSLLGDQLVSQNVLEEIQSEFEGVKKHNEALKVFERHGIRAYSQALALLGYKVKWSGLDPDNAEILKR
jgi:hypothetical protein